jgi:hypothetical protein
MPFRQTISIVQRLILYPFSISIGNVDPIIQKAIFIMLLERLISQRKGTSIATFPITPIILPVFRCYYLACPSSVSTTVSTSVGAAWAASNSANGFILCRICLIGVGIRLADTPVIGSTVLAIVGGIVLSPCLTVHGAVDSLGLVVVTQDVDDDLVADIWLSWGRRRVTSVVSGLRSASSGASFDTQFVCLNLSEREELIAHVGVGVGDWVVGGVDSTAKFHWTTETIL